MLKNFSVVICTYSRKDFIKNCLEKILNNSVLPKKIIIVDQNHDSVTELYAMQTFTKYLYKFPRSVSNPPRFQIIEKS